MDIAADPLKAIKEGRKLGREEKKKERTKEQRNELNKT